MRTAAANRHTGAMAGAPPIANGTGTGTSGYGASGYGVTPGGPGGQRRGGRSYYTGPHHSGPHHYHHHQQQQQMYSNSTYMPYGYYGMPPQYQAGAIPAGYMPYTSLPGTAAAAVYNRSPPVPQHYMPMMQQGYQQTPRQSPAPVSQYQLPHPPPAALPAVPPHTPTSTHSHHAPPPAGPPPPSLTPPAQQGLSRESQQPSQPAQAPASAPAPAPALAPPPDQPNREPDFQTATDTSQPPQYTPQQPATPTAWSRKHSGFQPPLPWLSVPDEQFPTRPPKSRRRKRTIQTRSDPLELPVANNNSLETQEEQAAEDKAAADRDKAEEHASTTTSKPISSYAPPRSETPSTPGLPPEDTPPSTSPTTPTSLAQPPQPPAASAATVPSRHGMPPARAAVAAVPVIPALPKASPQSVKPTIDDQDKPAAVGSSPEQAPGSDASHAASGTGAGASADSPPPTSTPAAAPAAAKPKLWSGLFNKPLTSPASNANAAGQAHATNGGAPDGAGAGSGATGVFTKTHNSSVAEALESYRVGNAAKVSFLEPRGQVNTGNMCYMNSVLQVLIFCTPFYEFLDQVSKRAAHSFKSTTPLLDSMINFMREFKVIDSATSVEQLRKRLKPEELEQFGEPFTPEVVYDAIRKTKHFSSMIRGHQQDAEEFLGFLLEGLHLECAQVMGVPPASTAPNSSAPSPPASRAPSEAPTSGDDWLEVGPRQRPAITRSSGHSNSSSPIAKIFGGQLRSELRVPGLMDSVTLEPYRPLQLAIGSPEVRNIIDALKVLVRPEALNGDFKSPLGKDVRAYKQLFIETLPPVLILHLKRFQFDAEGHGTLKIWKKVGYPLELEIPREVMARQKRSGVLSHVALPKYRLHAVVYHHGKNASGGHYTVDVRRQDGQQWIRLDDTVIRRVRSEDVAAAGAEDPAPAKGSGGSGNRTGSGTAVHKDNGTTGSNAGSSTNQFMGLNDEENEAGNDADEGWKPAPVSGKKWSSVVNAGGNNSSPPPTAQATKASKDHAVRDNKVAYLLFYQRV